MPQILDLFGRREEGRSERMRLAEMGRSVLRPYNGLCETEF